MTLNAAAIELEAIIKASGPVNVPIIYHGQRGTRVSPSIEMKIIHGRAQQMSLGDPGNNLVRYVGIAAFSIFTEGGKGDVEANGYADTIMTAYRNLTLATVRTQIPYPVARPDDGTFESMDVFVPFYRDAFEA